MGELHGGVCAAVLLLLFQGALSSPTTPTCAVPCLCQRGSLVNCSSMGLSLVPPRLPATATVLDLSDNALVSLPTPSHGQTPLWRLTALRLDRNLLRLFSLCTGWPRGACRSWAPALQKLSLEGNRLQWIPKGLGGSEFLQVLRVSHNQITSLRLWDLRGCTHLRELHMQHNLISTLHPLVFKDLHELQVLDLSFNALRTIPAMAYLSLRNLHAQVDVRGNRWRCDCELRTLSKWVQVDRDRLKLTWQVVCDDPPHLAGRDLLHLDSSELTCRTPIADVGSHQEVAADAGDTILLPCADQDQALTYWWTPFGQVFQSHTGHQKAADHKGLLIGNIQAVHSGLYVCVPLSDPRRATVFDVQVHTRQSRGGLGLRRIVRDLGTRPREMSQKSHSEFVLAVCLSVFITFACSFIIGALARPLLDTLWRRFRGKRGRPVGLVPHENPGFSVEEAEERTVTRRAPEVASCHNKDALMPYYITVLPEPTGSGTQRDALVKNAATVGTEATNDGEETYENVPFQWNTRPLTEENSSPMKKDHLIHETNGDNPMVGPESGGEQQADPCLMEKSETLSGQPIYSMEFEYIPDSADVDVEMSASEFDQATSDDGLDYAQKTRLFPVSALREELKIDYKTTEPGEDIVPNNNREKPDTLLKEKQDHPVDSETKYSQAPFGCTVELDERPGFFLEPFVDHRGPTELNQFDQNFDPESWNDSGESFEFSDSLKETSFEVSDQDPSDCKIDPQSPLDGSTLDEPSGTLVFPEPQDDTLDHKMEPTRLYSPERICQVIQPGGNPQSSFMIADHFDFSVGLGRDSVLWENKKTGVPDFTFEKHLDQYSDLAGDSGSSDQIMFESSGTLLRDHQLDERGESRPQCFPRNSSEEPKPPVRSDSHSPSDISACLEDKGLEESYLPIQLPTDQKSIIHTTSADVSGVWGQPVQLVKPSSLGFGLDPVYIDFPQEEVSELPPPPPVPEEPFGTKAPSSDDKQNRDWRKAGLFFQKKRTIDRFTPSVQSTVTQPVDEQMSDGWKVTHPSSSLLEFRTSSLYTDNLYENVTIATITSGSYGENATASQSNTDITGRDPIREGQGFALNSPVATGHNEEQSDPNFDMAFLSPLQKSLFFETKNEGSEA